MKLRSVCVGVAGGCCIMGFVAILWTLSIQELESNHHAIHSDETKPRLKRSGVLTDELSTNLKHLEKVSRCRDSSAKYGCIQSFDEDTLVNKVLQTVSSFSKWIDMDNLLNHDPRGSSEITGTRMDAGPIKSRGAGGRSSRKSVGSVLEEQRTIPRGKIVDGTTHDEENSRYWHRSRRDAITRSRFRTLDLASQGDTQYINLITPNPEIEITIDVLSGDHVAEEGDEWGVVEEKEEGEGPTIASDWAREGSNSDQGDQTEDGWLNVRRQPGIDQHNDLPAITIHWGQWSSCSSTCGGGMMERARYCGINCIARETLDCNSMPCSTTDLPAITIHWGQWSSCSSTCGGGMMERARYCGINCIARETLDCNSMPCSTTGPPTKPPVPVNVTGEPTDILSAIRVLDPNDFRTDSCTAWMSCRSEKLVSHLSRLSDLPGCPCEPPRNLDRNQAIFDEEKGLLFRWITMIVDQEWLAIYKPTASICIQSLLAPTSTSLAAQQCCYDRSGGLITRGPGAGTPNLISTEISPELNYKIDVMPWIICKGDWTKYNLIRPPNNALECPVSPEDDEYRQYWLEAKEF